MTDRELLELAAKAAGLTVWPGKWPQDEMIFVATTDTSGVVTGVAWNPLADDGDALRLAVKLRLEIGLSVDGCVYAFRRHSAGHHEPMGGTPEMAYAATRRSIVRAAAQLAKETD